jgi:putative hydrolase of the HAD superfamily
VHVGDGLDTDVAGAQACGMKAVWINRAGIALPDGYAPDAELPSLTGLRRLIPRLLDE